MGPVERGQTAGDRWLNRLLKRSMENELFRVHTLRFIDALPALTNDADLMRHFNEYFSDKDLPLPGTLKWGLTQALAPANDTRYGLTGGVTVAVRLISPECNGSSRWATSI